MDSTALAVLVGAVAAGAGGLGVPRLVASVPPYVPPEADETDAPPDGAPPGRPADPAEDPPEPYADIAALGGLRPGSAAAGVVAGALLGAALGWHWALLLWVPLVPVYVALAVVDWRTKLLPTYLIRPAYLVVGALVLVGWAVTQDTAAVVRSALGWLVAGGLFAVFWFIYPRGLGFGDVRLAGVLGIALGWVGWGALLVGVYAGFLLGGVGGGLLTLLRVFQRRSFPFGPFMLLGCLVGVLWGDQLWSGFIPG